MPHYIFLPGHMLPEGTSTMGAPLYQHGCAIMLKEVEMSLLYDEIRRIEAIEGVVAVKRAGDYAVVILTRKQLTGRDPIPLHICGMPLLFIDEGSEAHKENTITIQIRDW